MLVAGRAYGEAEILCFIFPSVYEMVFRKSELDCQLMLRLGQIHKLEPFQFTPCENRVVDFSRFIENIFSFTTVQQISTEIITSIFFLNTVSFKAFLR